VPPHQQRTAGHLHRHVAQREALAFRDEIGFALGFSDRKRGARDIVGYEGQNYRRRLDFGDHALRPQHDLVEAIATHAGIEHAAAGDALETGRPGLVVSDGIPLGHGVAERNNQRASHQRPIAVLLARALLGEGDGLAKQRSRGTGDRSPT
jgi:hypothetical protein